MIVNARSARIGDWIYVNGLPAKVHNITLYPPGTHNHSPIRNDLVAREVSTKLGSRWNGIAPRK
jgi:hypothetical protein